MRMILFLGGAAMAASFFLTWIEMPFAGPHLSPFVALQEGQLSLSGDASWRTWLFLGGFALAALAALLSLGGRGGALFAIVAGGAPWVILGDAVIRADDLRRDLGLPFDIDLSNLGQTFDIVGDFLRLGVWAYAGGAVLLLIAGVSLLLAPRR